MEVKTSAPTISRPKHQGTKISFTSPRKKPNPEPVNIDPPTVYFFISDYGNAKVKAFSDQFVITMLKHGINVFCERHDSHQPGYLVTAAAETSKGDFFLQVHSKTAGPGHVRIFEFGTPKRMPGSEATSYIISMWRIKRGFLSSEEIMLLSPERINFLIRYYTGINLESISEVQKTLFNLIRMPSPNSEALDKVHQDIFNLIMSFQDVATEIQALPVQPVTQMIKFPPLSQEIQEIIPVVNEKKISEPLRQYLLSQIGIILNKLHYFSDFIQKQKALIEVDILPEIPIDDEERKGDMNWEYLMESFDDNIGSAQKIASYGEIGNASLRYVIPDYLL